MTKRLNDFVGQVQERDFMLSGSSSDIDEVNRTVKVAFSSEEPVRRGFGNEILSHDKDSADLTRLVTGAPVLVGHNADDQVGVVESATIDQDRIGRATLRFGKSQRAQDIFQDIVDGIRQKISVGYVVGNYEERDNGDFVATDWQPIEISTVSIPADNRVGVGRDFETTQEVKPMSEETVKQPEIDIKGIEQKAQRNAVEVERKRVASIADFAERHGLQNLGSEFARSGKSLEEFRDAAFLELEKRYTGDIDTPETQIDMSQNEVKQYSLMKAVRAMTTNNWDDAGLELEASIAVADKIGRDTRGFFVPFDIQSRAQNTQTMTAGGALVGTDNMSGSFIELLRANSVVSGLGARNLTGLVGNADIPKQTAASTTYWIGEDGSATDSEVTFGSIQFSPKTLANAVPITRRLMMQSDPSIDALVMSDIAAQMALAADIAILEGDGVNKPLGLVNVTGVATSTIASAGAPTWAELVEFETDIDTANALGGSLAYVTTPAVKGNLKTTKKDAGSGIFLLDGGQANGYPVVTTTQLTANRIIFGDFSQVVIANWGVLEIIEDKATKISQGGIVLRAFQDMDSAIRHPESFCINA